MGDAFQQGATVPCCLTIRNHAQTVSLPIQPCIELSVGTLKKVKAKDTDAFETIERFDLSPTMQLEPGAHAAFERTIPLSLNAPITDRASSPYLLYGDSANSQALGQLLLTTQPHAHTRHVFDTMTTVFNFINKGESHRGTQTIAKFKAPDSRRFSLVEELNLSASFDVDSALILRFLFSVKKFDHSASTVNVKKGKVEALTRLSPDEYLFGGGFMRQEFLEEQIELALSEVSSGL